MSCVIRAIAEQDLDRVFELANQSAEAPRWTRRDYQQVLLDTPADPLMHCGLVAVNQSKLLGFAVASWLRHETAAELEGLFVQREVRRQGIGGALIAACMAWAGSVGVSVVRLEVRASNTAALRLYHRLGFSAVGVRRAYYSAPVEDALLFEAAVPL